MCTSTIFANIHIIDFLNVGTVFQLLNIERKGTNCGRTGDSVDRTSLLVRFAASDVTQLPFVLDGPQ
jgi:hypothetical protein